MDSNNSNNVALTLERLTDWVDGRLSEGETAAVAAQVEQADEETQATVAWLRAWKERQAKTVLVTPPDKARSAVLHMFRDQQRAGFIQQIIARLVTGGEKPRLATVGLRGSTVKAAQRRLTYETDAADITLTVQAHNKHFNLSGQIFLNDKATAIQAEESQTTITVQMLRGEVEQGITTANALGEFNFRAIPTGSYELVLSTVQFDIHVSPIDLHD